MDLFDEAIIYVTEKHLGAKRKGRGTPYVLHAFEVAQIISTMTDDTELMIAGLLHDVVEDTGTSIEEIREKFGERVAALVSAETENKYEGESRADSWKKRKESSLTILRNTKDRAVKMLWLADKLSNVRSIAGLYTERGEDTWVIFNQRDPLMHRWYYSSVAECLEMDFNKTAAYKELIRHINSIWPDTFSSEKSRYKKYREVSVEGRKVIGRGAKSVVYRYDDELIIKVYNENNTFKDIERENLTARKAFVAGIPTAISFGIVSVGNQYGSMFELINSASVSELIAADPKTVERYADVMAETALTIHSVKAEEGDFPSFMDEFRSWINGGVRYEDAELADKLIAMIDELSDADTLIHGDFHTGNIMMQRGEPLLIDMDKLSVCHPIAELAGVYMFYRGFGELDPSFVENFMGFSYETAGRFYDRFMERYFRDTGIDAAEASDKAALLCYARLVRRVYKKGTALSEKNAKARDYYMGRIRELIKKVDTFRF